MKVMGICPTNDGTGVAIVDNGVIVEHGVLGTPSVEEASHLVELIIDHIFDAIAIERQYGSIDAISLSQSVGFWTGLVAACGGYEMKFVIPRSGKPSGSEIDECVRLFNVKLTSSEARAALTAMEVKDGE